jgi:hypothetical protein
MSTRMGKAGAGLLTPEILHSALGKWYAPLGLRSVEFLSQPRPPTDTSDDYKVVYTAVFEPSSLAQARIELWLTDRGNLAFGFETRERIARRLNVRNFLSGFAAGHEPVRVELPGLLKMLEFSATGQLILVAKRTLFWLGGTTAALPGELRQELEVAGYGYLPWINALSKDSPLDRSRILTFKPWS